MGPRVGHVVVVESERRDGHPKVVRGRRRYRRPLLRVRLPRRLITGGCFLIRLLRGLLVDLVLLGRGLLVLLSPADSLRGIGPAHRRRPLHNITPKTTRASDKSRKKAAHRRRLLNLRRSDLLPMCPLCSSHLRKSCT